MLRSLLSETAVKQFLSEHFVCTWYGLVGAASHHGQPRACTASSTARIASAHLAPPQTCAPIPHLRGPLNAVIDGPVNALQCRQAWKALRRLTTGQVEAAETLPGLPRLSPGGRALTPSQSASHPERRERRERATLTHSRSPLVGGTAQAPAAQAAFTRPKSRHSH